MDAFAKLLGNLIERKRTERRLSSKYLGLTPTEIQVVNLVEQGKTAKEIADFFEPVDKNSIRKKIWIKTKKTNLRTYLLSIE